MRQYLIQPSTSSTQKSPAHNLIVKYNQNLQYSLPYSWPDQKFKTLFMTWPLQQNSVSDLSNN